MQRALRRAEWVVGVVWVVSWFEYYLEIYRHHHAAPPPWLGLPAPQLAVPQGAHAGGWLLMVLACSALAPCAFVALRAWRWSGARSSSAAEPRFPIGWMVGVFGLGLCAVGAVNQAIRRPPLRRPHAADRQRRLRSGRRGARGRGPRARIRPARRTPRESIDLTRRRRLLQF